MSDVPQGPGWWQASDGKWYSPEQVPGYRPATAPIPPPGYPAPYGSPPGGLPAATYQMPGFPPLIAQLGPLATWGERVIARLIDTLIIFVVDIPLFVVFILHFSVFGPNDVLSGIAIALLYLLALFAVGYIAYLNGSCGQSPGKALTGLIVLSETDGKLIGGGMGVVRELAHYIDSFVCYIGWFMPLWDGKKQTIADKAVKTLVFTNGPRRSLGKALRPPKNA